MEIHPKFKLNGESYSNQELIEVAYSLVKEGADFEIVIGDFILDWLSISKTVTVSTSGSTGKPKQIELQKRQMVNSALATGSFFNIKAGDSALLCLPCSYVAGKMMLVRAMTLGLKLDYVNPSSNPLEIVSKVYNFSAMIPLQVENSIEKLELIQKLIIGGAPVNNTLETKLEGLQTSIYETYGMTETISHIAIRKLGVTNFKALPKVFLKTDDRDCLVIAAPRISDNNVITNDIVELVSENEFKWLGRYDSIINSGGIKLIPEQIELKLSSVIKSRFFAVGLPDESLGEKLVVLVEGEEDPSLLEKVKSIKQLSKFEIPKKLYFLPEFVKTDNGKLNRLKTMGLLKS